MKNSLDPCVRRDDILVGDLSFLTPIGNPNEHVGFAMLNPTYDTDET